MNRREEVRERIAAFLYTLKTRIYWEDASEPDKEDSLGDAVRLLGMHDAQDNPLIVVLSEDQELPPFARVDIEGKPEIGRFYDGYLAGQQDMKAAGFVKVEKKK